MNSRIEGANEPNVKEILDNASKYHLLSDEEVACDIKITSVTDKKIEYLTSFQNRIGKYAGAECIDERVLYLNATLEEFKERVLVDEEVKKYLDMDKLYDFMYNYLDVNGLMCVENVVFFYEDDDTSSNIRKDLYDRYNDEEALFVCEDTAGSCWNRNTILINVRAIMEKSYELAQQYCKDLDYKDVRDIFISSIEGNTLLTLIHEFRHAVYQLNDVLPKGDMLYPDGGYEEKEVEKWGVYEMNSNPYMQFTLDTNVERPYLNLVKDTSDLDALIKEFEKGKDNYEYDS